MDHIGSSPNTRFCRLCDTFLTGGVGDDIAIVSELDSIAQDLALDENLRVRMGTQDPSIWPSLHNAWNELSRQVTLHEEGAPTQCLVKSFARLTRNLVAAVPSNQKNAFTSEPSLQRILHVYSSWMATQDPQSYTVTRMLVQTLSNIVTLNDDLMARLWETYMNLTVEQVIFIRLLGSPDDPTIISLLVLLINCIHESNRRRELLVETQVGARLCTRLLDRVATLYDADESSDEGRVFNYTYRLFTRLFDGGFAPKLYANLKVTDEIIAPHQTTLLKLLDSYLHAPHTSASLVGMCPMLTTCFFELCTFSIQAIRNIVGTDNVGGSSSAYGAFDHLLPKVCEALVLVTQCLVSAMLESEENHTGEDSKNQPCLLVRGAVSPHGQDIAVCAVGLLRILNIFVPPINFGKPVWSSEAVHSIPITADTTGFWYVKRDLVRLLGILCYKDKKTQDSIRICDGITVIMNMCVIDERNPYLREHAIFTLRNLLEDNKENQTVVNNIQSEGWDQGGKLQA